jgi:hypothetical protein
MNSIDLLSVRWIPKSDPLSDTIVVSIGDLVILDDVDGVFMIAEREDLKYCCSGCEVAAGVNCNNTHFRCSGVKIFKRVAVD